MEAIDKTNTTHQGRQNLQNTLYTPYFHRGRGHRNYLIYNRGYDRGRRLFQTEILW